MPGLRDDHSRHLGLVRYSFRNLPRLETSQGFLPWINFEATFSISEGRGLKGY